MYSLIYVYMIEFLTYITKISSQMCDNIVDFQITYHQLKHEYKTQFYIIPNIVISWDEIFLLFFYFNI